MPVPVTPEKSFHGSSFSAESEVKDTFEVSPVSPSDPCVVAGYEDCLRETIRFLVQEERLPVEHPVVAGLALHLTSDTAHAELNKVSTQLAQTLNEDLKRKKNAELKAGFSSGDIKINSSDFVEGPTNVRAYEITLEEDNGSEEDSDMGYTSDDLNCLPEDEMIDLTTSDMEDDDDDDEDYASEMDDILITAKDILSDEVLRRELIRLVFQGCDLIASPSSSINLTPAEK